MGSHPDALGGPSVVKGPQSWKREVEEGTKERRTWPDVAGFEDGKREPYAKDSSLLLESGKGEETNRSFASVLIFAQRDLCRPPSHRTGK